MLILSLYDKSISEKCTPIFVAICKGLGSQSATCVFLMFLMIDQPQIIFDNLFGKSKNMEKPTDPDSLNYPSVCFKLAKRQATSSHKRLQYEVKIVIPLSKPSISIAYSNLMH